MPRRPWLPALLAVAWIAASCGDNAATDDTSAARTSTDIAAPTTTSTSAATSADRPVIDPGDGGDYTVAIDPASFSSVVDHPYLPKLPGTRWVYEATDAEGSVEIITVEVLHEYRTVMGVETIVVHDVVETEAGELVEDTFDWFAQDADGNVWYFGEDTTSYEDGAAGDAGAWEAGVGGALPGIVMPATPVVSDIGYRQEFLAGEGEDMGQIIAISGRASVPAGDYDDVVMTRDWTPLEPDVVEEKTYASGVGFVHETKAAGDGAGEEVMLVEFTPGP